MYHVFFFTITGIVIFVNRNRKSETKVPLLAFPLGGGVNEVDGCEVAIRQNGVSTAQNEVAQTDAYASYPSSVAFSGSFPQGGSLKCAQTCTDGPFCQSEKAKTGPLCRPVFEWLTVLLSSDIYLRACPTGCR